MPRRLLLAAALTLVVVARAPAQPRFSPDDTRTGPKVLAAFRPVVAGPRASVVRVKADGKDAALGTVVAADGFILTKASELTGKVTCVLPDGKEVDAKTVDTNDDYDLALLKVDATGLVPIQWQAGAKVGQWVATVGPGPEPIAVGVVSVGVRKYKAGDQPPKNLKANSGYLGVGLDEAEGGAKVMQVMPGSPAAKAGLQINDLIVEADGKKIVDNETLINAVQRHRPGDEVTFKVRREDEELAITATLGKLPKGLLGNPQERFGNALSNRRGGFPTILQHDTVLKPTDCGGPLVDLDGKAVGVNIARAGRTETYAVPAADVQAVLAKLRAKQ